MTPRLYPSFEYALFISHPWSRKSEYEQLVNLLNGDPSFRWRNLSVPHDDPLPGLFHLPRSNRAIVHQLDEKISQADCLLVFAGMYAAHRAWMQSEIESAQAFGKPIVAVEPRGQERIPELVKNTATTIVRWNGSSIIDAVRRVTAVPNLGVLQLLTGVAPQPIAPAPVPEIRYQRYESLLKALEPPAVVRDRGALGSYLIGKPPK